MLILNLKGVWEMGINRWWNSHRKLAVMTLAGLLLGVLSLVSYLVLAGLQPKQVTLKMDGITKTVETHAETVAELLQEQDIQVKKHDDLSPGQDATIKDGMLITLNTGWLIPVVVDGATKEVHTTKRDVASVLEQAGVTLGKLDRVTPSLTATLNKDTVIKVTRVEEKWVTEEKRVPYQEVRRMDSTLLKGETKIIQTGQEGKALLHYKIVLEDGKEVSRTLVKQEIATAKRDRIVVVGTKRNATLTAAAITSRGNLKFRARQVLYNVTLTAYTPAGGGKDPDSPGYGRTATGVKATEGRTIAVDPNVIPLGWWVYIEGVGYRRAEDTGGAVKGNKIDVFFNSRGEALQFGRKRGKTVYIIGPTLP